MNTYYLTPKDNPKDLVRVVIGDDKQPDFIPQAKIQRWNDECNVSIRLKDTGQEPETFEEKDGLVTWHKGSKHASFYEIQNEEYPEGAFEFDITLDEKPDSNILEFTLVDKDVEYFYQPALTEKEIEDGASRPENVIGSYAVYAKTTKTNYVGGKEYKTGKIGHIYRPKIIDAEGQEIWGELNITDGLLIVTIPQEFLDVAVYPVTVDPTFGYTTAGGSSTAFNSSPEIGGASFTGAAGTATSITASCDTSGSPGTGMAIYKHSDSALVVGSDTAHWDDYSQSGQGWLTIPVSSTAITAQDYILVGTNINAGFTLYYDAGGTNQGHYASGDYYSWTTPQSFSHNNNKYSIYCTYTAGGGETAVKDIIQPGLIPFAR